MLDGSITAASTRRGEHRQVARRELAAIPTHTSDADLARFFTLAPNDLAAIDQRLRPAYRLDQAAHICLLRWLGRSPVVVDQLPDNARVVLGEQLNVKFPAAPAAPLSPPATVRATRRAAGSCPARPAPGHAGGQYIQRDSVSSRASERAEWTGTPLRGLLEEAGLNPQAREIVFTGLDQGVEGGEVQYYQRSLTVAEATREEMLLAYEMNGAPLEPQHGYPLRLVAPGWYGMASVKWLSRIEAVAEPFEGYQMVQAYRYGSSAQQRREPVSLIHAEMIITDLLLQIPHR
jgi:hypothetical protein